MTLPAGKNNRAFSLLELMLVLVLLGLGTAIVLPAIDRGLKNRDARHAALGLAAAARELGSRARAEGLIQRLLVDPPRNSYILSPNREFVLPPNLSFAAIEGGEILENGMRGFSFYPNGASFGGRVDFSAGDGVRYSVRFHPLTGRVEVLSGVNQ